MIMKKSQGRDVEVGKAEIGLWRIIWSKNKKNTKDFRTFFFRDFIGFEPSIVMFLVKMEFFNWSYFGIFVKYITKNQINSIKIQN